MNPASTRRRWSRRRRLVTTTVSAALTVALLSFALWFFLFRPAPEGQSTAGTQSPVPRPSLGKQISFNDYASAVDRALADVHTAESASGNERKHAIDQATSDLESVEGASVAAPGGGAPAEISNSGLIQDLRGGNPNLGAAEQALSVLASTLQQEKSASVIAGTVTGEEANARLRDVLKDQAFNYEHGLSPLQQLARWLASLTGKADPNDTLWRWFVALVAGIAGGVLTYLATGRVENKALRLALSVLAGIIVGWLFYLASGAMNQAMQILSFVGILVALVAALLIAAALQRATAPPGKPRAISELAAVLGMNSAEARSRAEEAAQSGDYRSAIRYRCLAVLLTLDEGGMLTFDRSATDREYLYRAPGDLQGGLQPLLSRFEAVWYGHAPTSEGEWHEYAARAAEIEQKALAVSRKAA